MDIVTFRQIEVSDFDLHFIMLARLYMYLGLLA